LQQKAGRQRQVEENMRENDTMKSIDRDCRNVEKRKKVIQDPTAPEHGEQPDYRDDHWQQERRA